MEERRDVRNLWFGLTNGQDWSQFDLQMSETNFTPTVRKRLVRARERLDYVPFGIISAVAREVGVQRQYAHSVIKDLDTFERHRGHSARKVWFCLERRLQDDEHVSDVEKVIRSLRNGEPYALKL